MASIFEQPLLGKFWSPDHSKKHSIRPMKSFVFVDALGLAINGLVCLLQLTVYLPPSRLFWERGGDFINLQTAAVL